MSVGKARSPSRSIRHHTPSIPSTPAARPASTVISRWKWVKPWRTTPGSSPPPGLNRSHGRYMTFQMAEVAVSRALFAEILRPIHPP
jgi:hypothetical protein